LEDRTVPTALSPCNFTSLGVLNLAGGGTFTINTSGTPSFTGPGGVNFTGVISGGVAVFDFDSVSIGSGVVINASGSRPVAILSHTTFTLGGTINSFGQSAFDDNSFFGGSNLPDTAAGGAGGGAGGIGTDNPNDPNFPGGVDNGLAGSGPGGGAPNQSPNPPLAQDIDPNTGNLWWGAGGAGGGGFGGAGAAGAANASTFFAGENDPAGAGGGTYGNLFNQLQGGSGGGGSNLTAGGGGGGAIELGAILQLTITSSGIIDVHGGSGAVGNTAASAGGSGGGVLLHAEVVSNAGAINASGGLGGQGGGLNIFGVRIWADAGGGGGGEVAVIVATTNANFSNSGTINVNGGASGGVDPGNPAGGIPAGFFGDGVLSAVPFGSNGTIQVRNQPLPPPITPLAAQVHIYFPVRYVFDPKTGSYSGTLTLVNTGPTDFTGPFAIVFNTTPRGVTILNASLSTGGPICEPGSGIFGGGVEPGGLLFINVNGNLINPSRGGSPLHVFIRFTNPFNINLSTFYHSSFGFGLSLFQGPFF
jgi:hypothetical protein